MADRILVLLTRSYRLLYLTRAKRYGDNKTESKPFHLCLIIPVHHHFTIIVRIPGRPCGQFHDGGR